MNIDYIYPVLHNILFFIIDEWNKLQSIKYFKKILDDDKFKNFVIYSNNKLNKIIICFHKHINNDDLNIYASYLYDKFYKEEKINNLDKAILQKLFLQKDFYKINNIVTDKFANYNFNKRKYELCCNARKITFNYNISFNNIIKIEKKNIIILFICFLLSSVQIKNLFNNLIVYMSITFYEYIDYNNTIRQILDSLMDYIHIDIIIHKYMKLNNDNLNIYIEQHAYADEYILAVYLYVKSKYDKKLLEKNMLKKYLNNNYKFIIYIIIIDYFKLCYIVLNYEINIKKNIINYD